MLASSHPIRASKPHLQISLLALEAAAGWMAEAFAARLYAWPSGPLLPTSRLSRVHGVDLPDVAAG
jgi:hypothetical protein